MKRKRKRVRRTIIKFYMMLMLLFVVYDVADASDFVAHNVVVVVVVGYE